MLRALRGRVAAQDPGDGGSRGVSHAGFGRGGAGRGVNPVVGQQARGEVNTLCSSRRELACICYSLVSQGKRPHDDGFQARLGGGRR